MPKHVCTEERFLKDVSDHAMTVICDIGVNRCIHFAAKKNAWNMHFTLITWPGHLCISGDMGTFVFYRLPDMFEFFRTRHQERLPINPHYWEEKCEADDRCMGGTREYDDERFKQCVKQDFDCAFEDSEDENAKARCWSAIKDEVLCAENEYEAHTKARDFEFEGFSFQDFWEHNLRSHTYHYIWCCYAIVWGIRQYDNAAKPDVEVSHA